MKGLWSSAIYLRPIKPQDSAKGLWASTVDLRPWDTRAADPRCPVLPSSYLGLCPYERRPNRRARAVYVRLPLVTCTHVGNVGNRLAL